MNKKPKILEARQPSEIAHVTFQPGFLGRGGRWRYYTTSQGGCTWDERKFKTKDEAISAAFKAGFGTVKVTT